MLELRIIADGRATHIFDLPALYGRTGAAKEIGDQIDALIAFMDDLSGDADLEPNGDDEMSGDEIDAAFPEWRPWDRSVPQMKGGHASALWNEDAEDDDEDMCLAGDDRVASGAVIGGGNISADDGPGDPEDAEENGDTELNGDEGDYSGAY